MVNTFNTVKSETELLSRGYEIDKKILSPHEFNIPHHRRRLFIVGALEIKTRWIKVILNIPEKHKKYTSTNLKMSSIDIQNKPLDGENIWYLESDYKKQVIRNLGKIY